MNKKTVLLTTSGMSPAILTETVWALAHESPPVIPDEVIVLTTASGKKQIVEQLLDSGIWKQLRSSILGKSTGKGQDSRLDFHQDRIRVVHRHGSDIPLDDLSVREDHIVFADAIMHELWAYTSQPDTRVVASLAGGFKTMSSLMISSMQLLASPGDRLTHVLVSGGFDQTSDFYFPEQSGQKFLTARNGAKLHLRAAEAAEHIHLIDIPLIPLRCWFRNFLKQEPPSYEALVDKSWEAARQHMGSLIVELSRPDSDPLWLKLNDTCHELKATQYVWLSFFVRERKSGRKPFTREIDLWEEIQDWIEKLYDCNNKKFQILHEHLKETSRDWNLESHLYKRLSDLRQAFKKLGTDGAILADALPSKGSWKLDFPPENLIFQDLP